MRAEYVNSRYEIMAKLRKMTVSYAIILLISSMIGLILLIGVYMLPIEPMKRNAQESIDIFEKEGPGYHMIDGIDASRLDNYTDSVMIGTAICEGENSPVVNALKTYHYKYEGKTSFQSFLEYCNGGEDYQIEEYSRYWQGYLVVLKPLLLLFNYSEIRLLNMILFVICVIKVIELMVKKGISNYITSFVMGIVFLMPITIMVSLGYAPIFYTTILSMWMLIKNYEKWTSREKLGQFYLIVGIITSYSDFLTYPITTVGFLLVTNIILEQKEENSIKNAFLKLIEYAASWGVGYLGMWGMKWICASILLGENVLKDAILMVLYRTSSSSSDSGIMVSLSRSDGLFANIKMINNEIFICLLIAFALYVIYRLIKQKRMSVHMNTVVCGSVVAVFPFIWYLVITNHSYVHAWMTYKNLAITIYALSMIGISLLEEKKGSV